MQPFKRIEHKQKTFPYCGKVFFRVFIENILRNGLFFHGFQCLCNRWDSDHDQSDDCLCSQIRTIVNQ